MWRSIKNFIVGYIWPFSVYQRKVNVLSDKLLEIEKEQEEKEREKVRIQTVLDELVKHIHNLDEERKEFLQKYACIEKERDKLGEEKKQLFQEYQKIQQERNELEEKYRLLETENQNINVICADLRGEVERYKKEESKKNGLGMSSSEYWNEHYKNNGNSGTGSYFHLAQFKAEIVNQFMEKEGIETVIEFGCGDGNQLSLISYKDYTGGDVSEVIIEKNKLNFQDDNTKKFFCTKTEREKYINKKYDMSISMDVIFHLLEDTVFYAYMEDLFLVAEKYVVIYSSNHEEYTKWPEFRHRNFTSYIQERIGGWELYQYIPNRYPYKIGQEETTSASDFYIFKKRET